jgi:Domain of unknown function (DUF4189)
MPTNAQVGWWWQQKLQRERERGYGAIARSPSTGAYAWTWAQNSRADAESFALAKCGGSDATIVMWARNAYIAFAVGDDGAWCAAWDNDQQAARSKALGSAGNHAQILVLFHSELG